MTIIIAYVINAVIAPTCIFPPSIFLAPNHTMPTVRIFIIIIMPGIINVITLFVKSIVFVRSLFASSNLSSSFFSLPNARITESPVRISLETRLILSTSFCISLNLGIAADISTMTYPSITAIASTIIHPMPAPVCTTFNTPPIPRIGAYATILKSITDTICICWMSFVLLVISDAVENLSISAFENPTTFLNTFSLSVIPIPTLEAKKPTSTVTTPIRSAIPSIFSPANKRYDFWIWSTSMPAALSQETA